MLTQIHIENFTIITRLELDLQSGMTVLTGETGAGKSILVDALVLVLGGRADSKLIRHGCDRCDITAVFDVGNIPLAQQWLVDHQFDAQEDCFLRRTLTRDGKSRSTINGQPAPLQLLRELGVLLVNIHGQHEHQTLVKRDEQRALLDAYGGHTALVAEVAALYTDWRASQDKYEALQALANNQDARTELLHYQVRELDALALGDGELIELEKEHKQLANADHVLAACQLALQLTVDQEEGCVLTLLNNAQAALETVKEVDERVVNGAALLNTAIIQVDEAVSELRHYVDHVEQNPERLAEVEQRLQTIYDVARKHKISPAQILDLHRQLADELQQFATHEEKLQQLAHHIDDLAKKYRKIAQQLSKKRTKAAEQLAKQVTESMQELGMVGGQLAIHLDPHPEEKFSAHGLEKVEFHVSANPGQPLQPLQKVASGGELSRISLAIQVITAQGDATPTLVFDEVDVGIGGGTAAIVGRLLKTLGDTAQVLCVTHLPQVAAQAHHHCQVGKSVIDHVTHTQVRPLSHPEKVQEVARMLGGLKITEQTLAHARELLETA